MTLEGLRAWSYRRQLLGRAAPDVLTALRGVIGVYSTHPTAPLSLLARSATFEPAELGALEQQRAVARIPAMRGSSFLLPAETASAIFGATQAAAATVTQRLRVGGVDLDTYARLSPRVLEGASQPVLPRELRRTVGEDAAVLVCRVLAREGLILRIGGHLRVDQLRYVSTQAWLGRTLDGEDPRAAWAWLAREYLRAFGPARGSDFAWWAGGSRRVAAAALDDAGAVDAGDGLLVLPEDRESLTHPEPLDQEALAVLPKWDAYTMAYAPDGRQRLVDDAHLPIAYTAREGSPGNTAGDGLPLILRGGRAVATWTHRFARDHMSVTVQQFPGEELGVAPLERAFEPVGQLMGAEIDLNVT